ncbi:MAG: hypothetical protein Q9170_008377, partial [Blastenia crenularia]
DYQITGGTGFVGYAVVVRALRAGYRVRLAIRAESDVEKFKAAPSCQPYLSHIEFALVKDMTVERAFDEALQDVSYVIHVASPMPGPDWPEPLEDTVIKPAIEGSLGLLYSAVKIPSVKRIVITSSATVIMTNDENRIHDGLSNPSCTGARLTPSLETTSAELPSGPISDAYTAYHVSKVLAYRAVQDFVRNKSLQFTVINLFPSFAVGRHELATSPEMINAPGSSNIVPLAPILGDGMPFPVPGITVHVNDVATAHVAALDPKIEGNQDFVLTSGGIEGIKWDDAKEIVRRRFPEEVQKGSLPLKGSTEARRIKVDGSKAERVLGFRYKRFEEQIVDLVRHYLDALEKQRKEN